jgi:hypothetical protein
MLAGYLQANPFQLSNSGAAKPQASRAKSILGSEGFTSQTPKPLNRPLILLLEHQKFMDFSKCLENPQNFSEHGK